MFKDLSLEELKDELKILYMLQRFEGGQARDIKEVKALIKEKTPKLQPQAQAEKPGPFSGTRSSVLHLPPQLPGARRWLKPMIFLGMILILLCKGELLIRILKGVDDEKCF